MTEKNKDQEKRKAIFPIDALKRGFSVPFFSLSRSVSYIHICVCSLVCASNFFSSYVYASMCAGSVLNNFMTFCVHLQIGKSQ